MKTKKKFKPVKGPFGGIDEQATVDAFEDYVGGVENAQRLLSIYRNSYPMRGRWGTKDGKSKTEVFCEKAKQDGFDDNDIDAFLMMQ